MSRYAAHHLHDDEEERYRGHYAAVANGPRDPEYIDVDHQGNPTGMHTEGYYEPNEAQYDSEVYFGHDEYMQEDYPEVVEGHRGYSRHDDAYLSSEERYRGSPHHPRSNGYDARYANNGYAHDHEMYDDEYGYEGKHHRGMHEHGYRSNSGSGHRQWYRDAYSYHSNSDHEHNSARRVSDDIHDNEDEAYMSSPTKLRPRKVNLSWKHPVAS